MSESMSPSSFLILRFDNTCRCCCLVDSVKWQSDGLQVMIVLVHGSCIPLYRAYRLPFAPARMTGVDRFRRWGKTRLNPNMQRWIQDNYHMSKTSLQWPSWRMARILDMNCPYLSSPTVRCDNGCTGRISPFAYTRSVEGLYRSEVQEYGGASSIAWSDIWLSRHYHLLPAATTELRVLHD